MPGMNSRIQWSAFFWVTGLFLLQNSLNYIFPGRIPSFILIGVVYYALLDGPKAGMIVGLFGGFFLDLFGSGRPGFSMFAYALSGVLAGFISSKIFRDSLLTEIFLPCFCFYGVTLMEVLSVKSQLGESAGLEVLAEAFLFWPIVTTVLASPILFSWLGKHSSASRYRRRPSLRV